MGAEAEAEGEAEAVDASIHTPLVGGGSPPPTHHHHRYNNINIINNAHRKDCTDFNGYIDRLRPAPQLQ